MRTTEPHERKQHLRLSSFTQDITGHTERTSPYNTLLACTLCLSIFISLQFTFFQSAIFFCQQSIELQHLCTQFEYLNSLPSLLSLAEGFSGECLKFSIWGRAGDAAVPSRQGSAFSALLLPSAGPGSAAALISLIPLPLAPSRASPGYRLARTWGICQILWQSHRVFLICHNKRDAPSQKTRGVF